MKKVPATFDFEKSLWDQNREFIVGIDEVGRGAWAGPLIAAAIIFPKNFSTKINLYDSKLLYPTQREELSKYIQENSTAVGIGKTDVSEIEKLGLTKATELAYLRALAQISVVIDHYLIDAFYISSLPKEKQTPIVHGDRLCSSIAAASIVAKVYRDNLMKSLDPVYKNYNFAGNKGYGTKAHQKAISNFGLTDVHRKNYHLKFLDV